MAVTPREGQTVALRLAVTEVLPVESGGDLALRAAGLPPLNAFVNLGELSAATGLEGKANLLLAGPIVRKSVDLPWLGSPSRFSKIRQTVEGFLGLHASTKQVSTKDALAWLGSLLKENWTLADAGLESVRASDTSAELRSSRVFLEPPVKKAAAQIEGTNCVFILTYLANLIVFGSNTTPYSMVTAAGPPYTPPDMSDDEVILTRWLAEDLHVEPGDTVTLCYFLPESGAKLIEATNRFRVRFIAPMEPPWADRMLMPGFPGIEKAETTHDWDAGFPLVHTIRPKDEDYWRKYHGTPKAFVTLAAGQKMWANRFGDLTAIRVPDRGRFAEKLLVTLKPEELDLRFEPVREQALKAAEQSQDFGQLFLGFSIFLVVAALLLMALLFQFGLEQRATGIGTLLALGFTAKQVRRLLLREAIVLALLGGVLGALGGVAYAKVMLWGLATIWRSAVGGSALRFHVTAGTLIIGTCASAIVAVLAIWLTLRKQARQPARQLLTGAVESSTPKPGGTSAIPEDREASWNAAGLCGFGWGRIGFLSGLGALAIIAWASLKGRGANAGAFFGAGSLLLIAGLSAASSWIKILARRAHPTRLTLAGLGVRACVRRGKRSLATVALLACGSFVIVAIGVFRLDANQDAARRSSGTGGFALLGESTMPVVQDLNTKAGREFFGLGEKELAGVNFVPFRVREGDEASCLNLNRAQQPRVFGVKPEFLAGRFTFDKVAKGFDRERGWESLRGTRSQESSSAPSTLDPRPSTLPPDEIPAIADANSIEWALGKKIGDAIDYTDEHGRPFKLRLVGAVANSILQGSLIIDESEFVKRFPGESGYRMFLIDVPSNSMAQVSATLSRAMKDVGLEVTSAPQRLNAFNAVQNTYLGTFQILGGLGLLLGSAGLGVVVLRNVLERRGELGLLAAVGFTRRALKSLVLSEHGALLGLGLAIGIISAAVAVLPALLSPGRQLPYLSLAVTLGAVLLNGALWTWAATSYALRGNLLTALRNE
jgi:ABC-type antimicrobial peptide transport system permease subunit